jgi:hypothetical protein
MSNTKRKSGHDGSTLQFGHALSLDKINPPPDEFDARHRANVREMYG